MAELENNRAGLQKKVSSVFKGVPIPQNNDTQQPLGTPVPDHVNNNPPKPVPSGNQGKQGSLIKKLQQPEETLDKTARAKKPEGVILVETTSPNLLQQVKGKLFKPRPGSGTTRQKAMIILIPVLSIVMIFMFRQVLFKAPHKTKGDTKNDVLAAAITDSDNEIDWHIPEPLPAMTRDPTTLQDQNNTQGEEQNETDVKTKDGKTKDGIISVRAIVFSEDKPSAVIDNKIVYVGDQVNEATVIKINKDSVEFEKDGKAWVHKISEYDVNDYDDQAIK